MITLPEHPDVVFANAPLVAVRCRANYSPVLALMTPAGVAGVQEALRDEYPVYSEKQRASFTFKNEIGIEQQPPIHSLVSNDGWRVEVTTTSVELVAEGAAYTTSDDFLERFSRIAVVVARTIAPGPTTNLMLRKENELSHPSVNQPQDWRDLLSPVLVGPFADFEGGESCRTHGEALVHVHGDDQVLEVRYGASLGSPELFNLIISRWTVRPYDLESTAEMVNILRDFADGATSIFHFLLGEEMKQHLEPHPRTTP